MFFFNSCTAKAVLDICIKAMDDSIILCTPLQLKKINGILFSIECWIPAMNASPEAAPKDPPMTLKSWAPTTTLTSLILPLAIATASACIVIFRADLSLSVYFLLSSHFQGSSFVSGVSLN